MPQFRENTTVSAVIWRFRDGRAGHENQVVGLSEAIARHCNAKFCDIYLDRSLRGLKSLLPGRLSFASRLPAPDLLIGAGHSTHLPLLTFQKRYGGKTVVIMKPSLPTTFFDLCLIPVHDKLLFQPPNVILTEGSLNRIRPSAQQDLRQGIVLIGGPSRHFSWSNEEVLRQVLSVTQSESIHWTLATSDRTPAGFVRAWRTRVPKIPLVTPQECSVQWLPEQLARCGVAWVTCDSMSMIYEALTAGSRVGLLELPTTTAGRVAGAIRRLTETARVTSWSQWMNGQSLPVQNASFSESDRCSVAVVQRCLATSTVPAHRRTKDVIAGRLSLESSGPPLSGLANFASGIQIPVS